MKPEFVIGTEKENVFQSVESYLNQNSFSVVNKTLDKPWGGFYVIDESQAEQFAIKFFPEDVSSMLGTKNKISPKILVVAPGKRLSWQYHFRRSEIWKLIAGEAGVVISETDEETPLKSIAMGEIIRLKVGERHRLLGLPGGWGAVAEIWQHTDPSNPSNEDDIVRIQDDFNRK